jgi:Flp pilus assembly pilin Flp
MRFLRSIKDETGQAMVEYALVVVLVGLAGLAILLVFAPGFKGLISHNGDTMSCPSGYVNKSDGTVACNP